MKKNKTEIKNINKVNVKEFIFNIAGIFKKRVELAGAISELYSEREERDIDKLKEEFGKILKIDTELQAVSYRWNDNIVEAIGKFNLLQRIIGAEMTSAENFIDLSDYPEISDLEEFGSLFTHVNSCFLLFLRFLQGFKDIKTLVDRIIKSIEQRDFDFALHLTGGEQFESDQEEGWRNCINELIKGEYTGAKSWMDGPIYATMTEGQYAALLKIINERGEEKGDEILQKLRWFMRSEEKPDYLSIHISEMYNAAISNSKSSPAYRDQWTETANRLKAALDNWPPPNNPKAQRACWRMLWRRGRLNIALVPKFNGLGQIDDGLDEIRGILRSEETPEQHRNRISRLISQLSIEIRQPPENSPHVIGEPIKYLEAEVKGPGSDEANSDTTDFMFKWSIFQAGNGAPIHHRRTGQSNPIPSDFKFREGPAKLRINFYSPLVTPGMNLSIEEKERDIRLVSKGEHAGETAQSFITEIVSDYNKAVEDRDYQQNFREKYGYNRFETMNAMDRRVAGPKEWSINPKFFPDIRRSGAGDQILIQILETGYYAAVPRFDLTYPDIYIEVGGHGEIFDCPNYDRTKRYRNYRLVQPVISTLTGDKLNWPPITRGELDLGEGDSYSF